MHTHTQTAKPPIDKGLSAVPHPNRSSTLTPVGGRAKKSRSSTIGERTDRIEGSFRKLTVHQLTLAWWLYAAGHLTKRQYRLYFAAHELHERRRYTNPEHKGSKPLYTMREIAALVGGRGDHRAMRALRTDIRALARLGLVKITKHAIRFAVSADEIKVEDLSGFWSMFKAMPNHRRSVPVPRRLLRAMAAGFSKGVTALISAILIRGLFWHKQSGDYRTDGRYKLSWIAEHFGISRRAATDARNTLIELGWLEPLKVSQWEMNRWGLRDRIVPEWSHTEAQAAQEGADPNNEPQAVVGGLGSRKESRGSQDSAVSSPLLPPHPGQPTGAGSDTGSATPKPENDTHSASPDLTDSLSLTGDLKTRRLTSRETAGVSPSSTQGGKTGSRKGSRGAKIPGKNSPPNIRDIRSGDLGDTGRLLELHRQACELGLASSSEAGRLAFMALAQRARSRGKRPGAMFAWLLREQKTAFITLSDEDQANQMLREHLHGDRKQWGGTSDQQGGGLEPLASERQESEEMGRFSEDERIVAACLRVAKSHRIADPYVLVRKTKGWSRQQWETALDDFHAKQITRIQSSNGFVDQLI